MTSASFSRTLTYKWRLSRLTVRSLESHRTHTEALEHAVSTDGLAAQRGPRLGVPGNRDAGRPRFVVCVRACGVGLYQREDLLGQCAITAAVGREELMTPPGRLGERGVKELIDAAPPGRG